MTTRDGQGSINKRQKNTKNKDDRDIKILMSLVDPSAMEKRAKAADKGVGYIELTSEMEEAIFNKVMKKVYQRPASS